MKRIITPGAPDFYINRNRYIETESQVKLGIEGRYRIQAIKPGFGVVRELEFPNLITDTGINAIGGNSPGFVRMHLGTGTAAPAFTDTALGAFGVNVQNGTGSRVGNSASSSPWFGGFTCTWESAIGGATGNWTEIGISNQNTTGNLRSRALILDGGGSPTVFPVLSDEAFRGSYTFRLYSPASDVTDNITLSGTPYTTTTRTLRMTSGWNPYLVNGTGNSPFHGDSSGGAPVAYTGALAAVTDNWPAGSSAGSGAATTSAYGSGNFYRDSAFRWGSGTSGTYRTLAILYGGCAFQVEYSPTIAKLTTQELIHNHRVSWARR